MQALRAGQVEKGLVEGKRFHEWCHLEHQVLHLAGCGCVFLHVGPDDNGVRAGFQRLEHGHGGLHAKGSRDVAACRDDATLSAAHDDRLVGEGRVVPLFDGGIEGVAIDVGDRQAFEFVVLYHARAATGWTAARCRRSDNAEAVPAQGAHRYSRTPRMACLIQGAASGQVSMRAWACGLGGTRLASRASATK